MKIVNVGYNYKHPEGFSIYRPYGSGDYILLLLRTDAYFIINGKKQITEADSLIIYKKGTPQYYGALNGEYVNDWIHFELNEKEEEKFNKLNIPFDTVLKANNTTLISGFIKSMFNELYSQNTHKKESLRLYFELILIKISEIIKLSYEKKENPFYNEFTLLRNEIYLKPEKDWSVEKICKKMNLSRSYVQHLYKSFFNKSIISDITQSRIEHAKYLLSSTDMTVSCISSICGYNNDVHFMRIFKKEMGVTPSGYRKQIHINQNEVEIRKNQNPFCLKSH